MVKVLKIKKSGVHQTPRYHSRVKVIYTNAWSIRNKINELNCIINTKDIDIIAITETHLKIGTKDLEGEY